jgi:hypothetical protein
MARAIVGIVGNVEQTMSGANALWLGTSRF